MEKTVSIIIPVYNGADTIERAIESCLQQTYAAIEVIVIDNQSTDETQKVVTGIQDKRVRYIRLEEKGRSLARNTGLAAATGEYLQFLDADDTLFSHKILDSVTFLEQHLDYDAYCHGILYLSDESGETLKEIFPKYCFENELLAHNIFPIHSLVFRAKVAATFTLGMEYCEDWLFWVDALLKKKIYFNTTEIAGTVFVHGNNTMSQTTLMSEYELYVQQCLKEKHSERSLALLKNEVTLLIIHYFNPAKEPQTIEAIKKHSRWTYLAVQCLCHLPIIKGKLKQRIAALHQKNVYTEGEVKS
ncbi:glycosyltransferase family 2 protein [Isobaculum melis]|uniref:Glycosyl transferase family 2 n=1 Tax=Isobaculum melis TaxID=142588 RepID=A0A1H9QNW5_9LACT|nr:glycosyltransferase [Isobaculum melis]SER62152.1 Glycosyl transferase family 2 [Isobaculum melis]